MKRALGLVAAILVSGSLFAFALPPHDMAFLGWFALTPVVLAVRRLGFAFGFASGIGVCLFAAWIDTSGFLLSPAVMEGDHGWTYAGFALFGLVVGITLGVLGVSEQMFARPWLLAAWAVMFEAALLIYLPAHLALTQYRSSAIMFLCSWVGIWGVSYAVWFVNLALARLYERRKTPLLVLIVVLAGLLAEARFAPQRGDLNIAAVQTRSTDIDELAALNAKAGKDGGQMVVWPELSASYAAMRGETPRLVELAKKPGQRPFVTTFGDGASPMPYNAAAMFSAVGESERYLKRKPFAGEKQIHAAGTRAVAVEFDGVRYGLNICFDSCFPSIMRDTAKIEGADVILLPTLDPDTPYGIVQAMHAAYTPFRAAELGLPIVRADITAYSMIVDAHGRIMVEAGAEQGETIVASMAPGKRWTLVTVLGDWFLFACGLLALAGFISGRPKLRSG